MNDWWQGFWIGSGVVAAWFVVSVVGGMLVGKALHRLGKE